MEFFVGLAILLAGLYWASQRAGKGPAEQYDQNLRKEKARWEWNKS